MGAASKKRRSDDRRKRKRAMKAMRREQYRSLAGTSRSRAKSVQPGTLNHATSDCVRSVIHDSTRVGGGIVDSSSGQDGCP